MKPPNMAPVYVHLWERATEIAREHGYCLSIHGTLNRDLDLLACPWTEEAVPADALVAKMAADLAWLFAGEEGRSSFHICGPVRKPHGRLAYTIPYMAHWQIDLSVMPRTGDVQPASDTLAATHTLGAEAMASAKKPAGSTPVLP